MESRIIAISGQPGSGSTTTAELIAQNTGLKLFSPGFIFKAIDSGEIWKDRGYFPQFREMCESRGLKIPVLSSQNESKGVSQLWRTDFGKSSEVHHVIDDLQIRLAEAGSIILDGKLTIYMLRKHNIPAALSVWLEADERVRADRHLERELKNGKTYTFDEALKDLYARQYSERTEWGKIYGLDPWNQKHEADIIINTTNFAAHDVAKALEALIPRTPQSE